MDSRNNLQYPFARPLSQPNARDPRQAPIPPPPYTLQAHPHRLQPSLNNDPFLPRRNERDESRQELPKPSSQGPYSIGSYTAHLPRENVATPMEIRDRPQENSHGGSWLSRVADGRPDRYRHHATEGKLHLTQKGDVFILIIRYSIGYSKPILLAFLVFLGVNISLPIALRLMKSHVAIILIFTCTLMCLRSSP